MTMKNYIIIGGVVVLAVVAALWAVNVRTVNAPSPVACTQEAKICPDGSSVGRIGPNCEFAQCPIVATTTSSTGTKSNGVAIGSSVTLQSTTIKVTGPVDDSRCPKDVQCVWAGTVGVHVSINASSKDTNLILNQPQTVGNAVIMLVGVTPGTRLSTQTIAQSDYRLTFTVVPITTTPLTSGVQGIVSLGPTCPVMQNPPTQNCADKPYPTAITVYRAGSSSPFIVGNSNASGAYTFSLPPGSYTLKASGGTTLPRCAPVNVTVTSNTYATANIYCDTGMR